MTIDELIQQLNKIKEIYPDGGKFQVLIETSYNNLETTYKVIKIKDLDKIVIT